MFRPRVPILNPITPASQLSRVSGSTPDVTPVGALRSDELSLEALDLECIRGNRELFKGVSFTLRAGEILQVDGPNGSGKTSLLRVLCGLTLPVRGEVRWCGEDIQRVRSDFLAQVVYVGHAHGVKEELTPLENLKMARALGRSRQDVSLEHALVQVGLYGFEDVPARTLSAGQRRRVALARLLVCDGWLWVLDEPFTALDRTGIKAMESLLEAHVGGGGMVVLTTHQLINLACGAMTRIHLAA